MQNIRKKRSQYCLRKRYIGLNYKLEKDKSFWLICLNVLSSMLVLDDETDEDLVYLVNFAKKQYESIAYEPQFILPAIKKPHKMIDHYQDSEIDILFGLQNKSQLFTLYQSIGMEEIITFDNKSKMHSETVFLFSLRKLRTTMNYSSLINEFGGEESVWSRAFNYFINHVCAKYEHLIINSIHLWTNYFEIASNKIKQTLINNYHCDFMKNIPFYCFGFIDNTGINTCAPGTGPTRRGKKAPRKDNLTQQVFYNGWKHEHGVKFQLVLLPNGIIAEISQIFSIRHNDLYVLFESKINERLANCQNSENDYILFGDSAYIAQWHTHIHSYYKDNYLPAWKNMLNNGMKGCRNAVENCIGSLKAKFQCLRNPYLLKIQLNDVTRIIKTCVILHNLYTCLNGNQITSQFGSEIMDINYYLNLNNN